MHWVALGRIPKKKNSDKLLSFVMILDSDLFELAWRGSEVKSTPTLQSRSTTQIGTIVTYIG